MPYKDKEQARQATKERVRRYRERRYMLHPIEAVTPDVTPDVTPEPARNSIEPVRKPSITHTKFFGTYPYLTPADDYVNPLLYIPSILRGRLHGT